MAAGVSTKYGPNARRNTGLWWKGKGVLGQGGGGGTNA